jgi:hypothetical protein
MVLPPQHAALARVLKAETIELTINHTASDGMDSSLARASQPVLRLMAGSSAWPTGSEFSQQLSTPSQRPYAMVGLWWHRVIRTNAAIPSVSIIALMLRN